MDAVFTVYKMKAIASLDDSSANTPDHMVVEHEPLKIPEQLTQ